MFAEERQREILSLVKENKSMTVEELTKRLNASESTIRRDLAQLDRMGRLNKVHGGATVIDRGYVLEDQAVAEKSAKNPDEKKRIAVYAAGLIGEKDFVYIDAGTTTDRLIDCLSETRAADGGVPEKISFHHRLFRNERCDGRHGVYNAGDRRGDGQARGAETVRSPVRPL